MCRKKINKTPTITSSQKNSFAIYYDGCLVNSLVNYAQEQFRRRFLGFGSQTALLLVFFVGGC
jgi:hypothetical protein